MRILFLTALLFLISCSASMHSSQLKPFITDGCSMYPNGNWAHCCMVHDMKYWAGGTSEDKVAADQELGACIERSGSSINARVVIGGVEVGGAANDVLPWAWGYGWSKNPGYAKLSRSQLKRVDEKLNTIIPGMRDYDVHLSKEQFDYIVSGYRKFQDSITKALK